MSSSKQAIDEELQRQALENQIKRLEQRVTDLKGSNKELRNAKINCEDETEKFVAYFHDEIRSRDEIIGDLKRKCKRLETESSNTFESTKAYYEAEIHALKEASESTLSESSEKLKGVLHELDILAEFKEKKLRVESRVRELEENLLDQERNITGC